MLRFALWSTSWLLGVTVARTGAALSLLCCLVAVCCYRFRGSFVFVFTASVKRRQTDFTRLRLGLCGCLIFAGSQWLAKRTKAKRPWDYATAVGLKIFTVGVIRWPMDSSRVLLALRLCNRTKKGERKSNNWTESQQNESLSGFVIFKRGKVLLRWDAERCAWGVKKLMWSDVRWMRRDEMEVVACFLLQKLRHSTPKGTTAKTNRLWWCCDLIFALKCSLPWIAKKKVSFKKVPFSCLDAATTTNKFQHEGGCRAFEKNDQTFFEREQNRNTKIGHTVEASTGFFCYQNENQTQHARGTQTKKYN